MILFLHRKHKSILLSSNSLLNTCSKKMFTYCHEGVFHKSTMTTENVTHVECFIVFEGLSASSGGSHASHEGGVSLLSRGVSLRSRGVDFVQKESRATRSRGVGTVCRWGSLALRVRGEFMAKGRREVRDSEFRIQNPKSKIQGYARGCFAAGARSRHKKSGPQCSASR